MRLPRHVEFLNDVLEHAPQRHKDLSQQRVSQKVEVPAPKRRHQLFGIDLRKDTPLRLEPSPRIVALRDVAHVHAGVLGPFEGAAQVPVRRLRRVTHPLASERDRPPGAWRSIAVREGGRGGGEREGRGRRARRPFDGYKKGFESEQRFILLFEARELVVQAEREQVFPGFERRKRDGFLDGSRRVGGFLRHIPPKLSRVLFLGVLSYLEDELVSHVRNDPPDAHVQGVALVRCERRAHREVVKEAQHLLRVHRCSSSDGNCGTLSLSVCSWCCCCCCSCCLLHSSLL
mmetsp:Transcript_1463/g.3363  ORF Transcript_1463/g.3363 Transcript_1463/m.3363 type:complete len:288 (+) Transcript_1463:613-1476(+)